MVEALQSFSFMYWVYQIVVLFWSARRYKNKKSTVGIRDQDKSWPICYVISQGKSVKTYPGHCIFPTHLSVILCQINIIKTHFQSAEHGVINSTQTLLTYDSTISDGQKCLLSRTSSLMSRMMLVFCRTAPIVVAEHWNVWKVKGVWME